jgi:hypothetical protein
MKRNTVTTPLKTKKDVMRMYKTSNMRKGKQCAERTRREEDRSEGIMVEFNYTV